MIADPILVADIGGTNARFALADAGDVSAGIQSTQVFRAKDFETIGEAANAYLETVSVKPKAACFAVAGPVASGAIAFTNSPWVLRPEEINSALALERFLVVNDFEALAAGVNCLAPGDFEAVKPGEGDPAAPRLVIGPGTGLGQALIVPFGDREKIIPTEGGHVSFAPRTDVETEIMRFIAREHPRVSLERLLSGRGLINIHRALCALAGTPCVSLRADEIAKAAVTKKHPIAAKTVETFCAILGAAAGDAALGAGARGGVMLGGGILPKIREIFLRSKFVQRFLDKGRMRAYLEPVPVRLIIRDGAALLGAAAILREDFDVDH